MKIAVASQGPDLDARMDQRFGRCPYVLIVETEDLAFEAVKNPYVDESGGVGSRLAALIAKHGAKAVVAAECGPNAQDALNAAGIALDTRHAETVREAVEQYKAGLPNPASATDERATAPAAPAQVEQGGRGRKGRGHGHGGGRRRRRRECRHQ
jgi:predicted Fe-Mo cluster-binding NifX family protein